MVFDDGNSEDFMSVLMQTLKLSPISQTIVRCKNCKHRPIDDGSDDGGFSLIFPDYVCPYRCDDSYYNRMPKDDWYCHNGEI